MKKPDMLVFWIAWLVMVGALVWFGYHAWLLGKILNP